MNVYKTRLRLTESGQGPDSAGSPLLGIVLAETAPEAETRTQLYIQKTRPGMTIAFMKATEVGTCELSRKVDFLIGP